MSRYRVSCRHPPARLRLHPVWRMENREVFGTFQPFTARFRLASGTEGGRGRNRQRERESVTIILLKTNVALSAKWNMLPVANIGPFSLPPFPSLPMLNANAVFGHPIPVDSLPSQPVWDCQSGLNSCQWIRLRLRTWTWMWTWTRLQKRQVNCIIT